MRFLMVCLGNICRSPLAEGILKKKIEETGLPWQVDSAGTGAWHIGELPDRRSIQVAAKYGIDITYQRARQFNAYDLEAFDHIYVMDSSNYQDVIRLAKEEEKDKVKLIMELVYPERNISVPDPYHNDNGFEEVYNMLSQACDKIVEIHHSKYRS